MFYSIFLGSRSWGIINLRKIFPQLHCIPHSFRGTRKSKILHRKTQRWNLVVINSKWGHNKCAKHVELQSRPPTPNTTKSQFRNSGNRRCSRSEFTNILRLTQTSSGADSLTLKTFEATCLPTRAVIFLDWTGVDLGSNLLHQPTKSRSSETNIYYK